jgi:CubicO group peptidase (beta-lactamase class C family)
MVLEELEAGSPARSRRSSAHGAGRRDEPEDFIEQEIFAPLGMKSSRYGHQREVIPGRVAGYDKTADGYRIAEYISMTQPYAAGSLMSTVDDLALSAEALAGGKVIKKESLERMTTPAKLKSGMSTKYAYGLGVSERDGARIVEHGGGIFGFVTCSTCPTSAS